MSTNDEGNQKLALLFFQNKKACAIIVIRQKTDHGLAIINKTKTDDHPHGVAWKAIKAMKQKDKPKDMSAEIKMEAELQKIQFRSAINYYNEIVVVTSRYKVKKTDTGLIKIMSTKMNSTMFAAMILSQMEDSDNADDLEELCNKIGKIQHLAKVNGKSDQSNDNGGKETQLNITEGGGTFKGIFGNCKT